MYTNFASFYDRVEGDAPAGFARWIVARVDEYNLSVGTLLELGCGTGAVLAALPESWRKTGVDLSSSMLKQARKRGIDATLIEADLTELTLGVRFDLVVCVFDTINHLLVLEQWRAAFKVAREHVNPGGLFLFDMNTLGRLSEMASQPVWVQDFDENTLIMKISNNVDDRFDWDIRVFERRGDHFRLHHEVIQESALPLEKVHWLLESEGFDVLESTAGGGLQATEESGRVFFVCRAR